jgi:pimeloyl-ACP methyl ester carboxylesterase
MGSGRLRFTCRGFREDRFVDVVRSSVDRVSVAFEDRGIGAPTLVFIHGLTGDHSDFDAQMSFFESSNRVVGIDLPGSGESGRGRVEWTMATFGNDVVDVVDHLGLADLVLIGHSFGGDVTVEAARLLGDRVRALVWVSSHRTLGDIKTDSQIEEWLAPFATGFVAAMDDLTRRHFGPNLLGLGIADPVRDRHPYEQSSYRRPADLNTSSRPPHPRRDPCR